MLTKLPPIDVLLRSIGIQIPVNLPQRPMPREPRVKARKRKPTTNTTK